MVMRCIRDAQWLECHASFVDVSLLSCRSSCFVILLQLILQLRSSFRPGGL